MRSGGGKQKGSAFEREICKRLSLWISNGEKPDVFWRSAMSGGRATVARGRVRQCGDVCAVAEEGNAFCAEWYVECKHVKHVGLDSFLVKNTGTLSKFWRITVREAKNYNRRPMLIFRQNGWPTLVLVRDQLPRVPSWAWLGRYSVHLYSFDEWMESNSAFLPAPRNRRRPQQRQHRRPDSAAA